MKQILLAAIVMLTVLVVAGCTTQNTGTDQSQSSPVDSAVNPVAAGAPVDNGQGAAPNAAQSPSGQPRYPRQGNFSAADRAAIMQVMTQACSGLSENDSCTFTLSSGQSGTGTCVNRNDTLFCRGSGGSRQGYGGSRQGSGSP